MSQGRRASTQRQKAAQGPIFYATHPSLMPRTATAEHYTYLDCPNCGQGIAEPFAVTSGPVPFVHGHGQRRCRLIVWPDPQGQEHRMWEVPHNVSLEEAIVSTSTFAEDNGWSVNHRIAYGALATAA